ncbi:DUF4417 domain-containing protein [Nocardia sp. NPDC057227]|uniref:DUF4417 domain-containing protein n=1 Tax=Nocardia sp. NPDC057227 TaxID=3346056 RepID=UPI00362F6D07
MTTTEPECVTKLLGTKSSHRWQSKPGRMDSLNLRFVWPTDSRWGIPTLQPCGFEPESLAAWHDPSARVMAAGTGALHFFLDDYRFERTWTSPEAATTRVAEVGAALTPDFSLWRNMPLAAQVWQVYRSRWVGAWWQHCGLKVIPTVSWAGPETFDFAFDGLPAGATLAVGTVGLRDPEAKTLFRAGVAELLTRCTPSLLLVYGRLPAECDDLDLPRVRGYPTWWQTRKARSTAWVDEELPAGRQPASPIPLDL